MNLEIFLLHNYAVGVPRLLVSLCTTSASCNSCRQTNSTDSHSNNNSSTINSLQQLGNNKNEIAEVSPAVSDVAKQH